MVYFGAAFITCQESGNLWPLKDLRIAALSLSPSRQLIQIKREHFPIFDLATGFFKLGGRFDLGQYGSFIRWQQP
jgi:hypothetical protein